LIMSIYMQCQKFYNVIYIYMHLAAEIKQMVTWSRPKAILKLIFIYAKSKSGWLNQKLKLIYQKQIKQPTEF